LFDEAHAAWLQKLGPDHPDMGILETNRGELGLARGEPGAARSSFERAVELFGPKAGEADSSDLGYPLVGLARAHLALGDVAAARTAIERAIRVREGEWLAPGDHLLQRVTLARAVAGEEPQRARTIAESALAEHTRAPSDRIEEARLFLAELDQPAKKGRRSGGTRPPP
jgi:hypothetical protein